MEKVLGAGEPKDDKCIRSVVVTPSTVMFVISMPLSRLGAQGSAHLASRAST